MKATGNGRAFLLNPSKMRALRELIGDEDIMLTSEKLQNRIGEAFQEATIREIPVSGGDMPDLADRRMWLEVGNTKDIVPLAMTSRLRIEGIPFVQLAQLGLGGSSRLREPDRFTRDWFDEQADEDPGVFFYLTKEGKWEKAVLLKATKRERGDFFILTSNRATTDLALFAGFGSELAMTLKNTVLKAMAGSRRILNPHFGQILEQLEFGKVEEGSGQWVPDHRPGRPVDAKSYPFFSLAWFAALDLDSPGVGFDRGEKVLQLESAREGVLAWITRNEEGFFLLIREGSWEQAYPLSPQGAGDRFVAFGRHLVIKKPGAGVDFFSIPGEPEPYTRAWHEALPDSNPAILHLKTPSGSWQKAVLLATGLPTHIVFNLLMADANGIMSVYQLLSSDLDEAGFSVTSELLSLLQVGIQSVEDTALWEGLQKLHRRPISEALKRGEYKIEGEFLLVPSGRDKKRAEWLWLSPYVLPPVPSREQDDESPFSHLGFLHLRITAPGVFFIGEKKFVLLEDDGSSGAVLITQNKAQDGLVFVFLNSLSSTLGSEILEKVRSTQKSGASRFLSKTH
ncbi:MAG: hypothetical protein Q7S00_08160, partial [bacterium]|nr:hypothetical protein [bacterium]